MKIRIEETFQEQMSLCKEGDICSLWLSHCGDFANVYRPGSVGGQGKIASLQMEDNPELYDLLLDEQFSGQKLWFEVTSFVGRDLKLRLCQGDAKPRNKPGSLKGRTWNSAGMVV